MPSPDPPPPAITPILRLLAPVGLLAALACGLSLGACSPQGSLLSVLLEPPPPGRAASPRPVVRKPRHPPPEKPPPLPAARPELETPEPTDWLAFRAGLPHIDDDVDWSQALATKAIAPSPGIEPDAQDESVLELELELVPKGAPNQAVTFSHKAHTEWLACANCHPAIFEMQQGADPITMGAIFAGKYCGVCHGKATFAIETGCPRCHKKSG